MFIFTKFVLSYKLNLKPPLFLTLPYLHPPPVNPPPKNNTPYDKPHDKISSTPPPTDPLTPNTHDPPRPFRQTTPPPLAKPHF